MSELNNETHELSIDELDTIAGGLSFSIKGAVEAVAKAVAIAGAVALALELTAPLREK
jgi:hypothetical protein